MITRPVGFLGLGVMGSAMSSHLLTGGWRVLGFDISAARLAEHRDRCGETADSPAEIGERCDLVVTSLPHAAALRAALGGAAGGPALDGPAVDGIKGLLDRPRAGLVVLETSTLELADKDAAQRTAAASSVTVLDCPMSGTGAQARAGDLVAYLSGDEAAKLTALPALQQMTRAVHDVGRFGNGTRMKLVANLLVAVHNLAAAEALLLAERAGLHLPTVLEAVGDGAGTSRMFEIRGPLMAKRLFDDATMKVSTFQKDLDIIGRFAADLHSPVPLLSTTAVFYRAAAAQGLGELDTASVFDVLRGLAEPTAGEPAIAPTA